MQKLPTKGIHHNLMFFFLWSTKMNTNQDNHVIIKSAAKNFEIGVENHSLTKSDKFSPHSLFMNLIYLNASMKPRVKDIHGINTVKIQAIIPDHFKNLLLKYFPKIIKAIPIEKSVIKVYKKFIIVSFFAVLTLQD
jgi:hypothetical protein